MPLKHSKSKKAFESNIKAEMHAGKPQDQALAIAYSVKRKAKKAAGGSVQSGSRDMDMAEGGAVSVPQQKRPMPENAYNDAKNISQNSSKKATPDNGWTDQPTVKQARKPGMNVTKIKNPKMAPQSGYSTRLRDEEDDLLDSAAPGSPKAQPPRRDDEEGADRQGPDNVDKSKPHSGPKSYAKGGKIEQSDYKHNMGEASHYPDDLYDDEMHLQSSASPSEDEGERDARRRNEMGADRQGPSMRNEESHSEHSDMFRDDEENMSDDAELNPAHGHYSSDDSSSRPEDEYEESHKSSVADLIMTKMEAKKRANSGSRDMDDAVAMFEGGEITEHRDHDDISSHGSMDSDDSDQVDLSRNADEDANEEDQASYQALMKENYSESDALDDMDQPRNSNLRGDEEESSSHDRHDRVSSIMRQMEENKRKARR